MRRAVWLGTGVALGAGGTVWVRRRIDVLAQRWQPARVAVDVASGVEQRVRSTPDRVRSAVAGGREDARRREAELRRQLRLADPAS